MGNKGHGIEELSGFAMEFIKQAGKKALPFYGKGRPQVKFDQEMVTQADLQITEFFQKKLNERFPDHHVFKYDQLNENYSHEGKRYLWIFDPIEGVANYQAGIPIWGMSVALHYRSTFPGKIRNMGCASAHICYVAMGRADGAVIANESFQGLAAARVIIEAAGGKVCTFDGCDFHLNEYLDGQKIDDHLLVAASGNFMQVRNCLKPIS